MPALPQSVRFANYDTSVILYVPTIANAGLVATRAELTAGTDLTAEISDVAGWAVVGATIDTPDLKSEFVSKIAGRTSSPDSSLTFYADEGGTDVRDVLPYKTTGFIVTMPGGDVTAGKMNVYPVRVTNPGVVTISTADETAKIMVGFAITREPGLDLAIPATV